MAELIPCKVCGKLFKPNGYSDVCDVCKVKDDEIYSRLREYLMQNPGAKIFQVSTLLDIPVYYIKRYLREEKLEIIEKDNRFLACEKCGASIRSGKLCDGCAAEARNKAPSLNNTSSGKYDVGELGSTNKNTQKIKYFNSL